MKKITALLLALVMMLSLAACGKGSEDTAATETAQEPAPVQGQTQQAAPDPSFPGAASPDAAFPGAAASESGTAASGEAVVSNTITPEPLGSGTVKWAEETTADGWIKVTNAGGAALGYSPASGVSLIQVDGFAFKDLNRNGLLDVYEDWRQEPMTRAYDLAAQMPLEQIFGLMLHGDMGSLTEDGTDATGRGGTPRFTDLMQTGMRSCLNRSAGRTDGRLFATFNNNVQVLAETLDFGIPVSTSANPSMEYVNNLALAATFDPEIAAEVYRDASVMYRATGVSTLLGPQVDLSTEPRWNRISGTFGEDTLLSADMANAAISALQSTYDENGNDLGWGEDSVIGMMKHFPGDGPGESGRESHSASGKYAVYPGKGFETALVPFVEGGLRLRGLTGEAAGVMTSYSIAYSDTQEYGDLVGSAFSLYKLGILRDTYGYEGVVCSDWFILKDYIGPEELATPWGYEDASEAERLAAAITAGMDQIGGANEADFETAYLIMVRDSGEEFAEARVRSAAAHITGSFFKAGLFENPYVDTTTATDTVQSFKDSGRAREIEDMTVVMLKNSDGLVGPAGAVTSAAPSASGEASGNASAETNSGSGEASGNESAGSEKPTVYIPMTIVNGKLGLPVDEAAASELYNIVTDTAGEPTGAPDRGGNPTYCGDDIIRAASGEIAACDMALVVINNPVNEGSEATGYGHDNETGEYFPISLQFSDYTADSAAVRQTSISGDMVAEESTDTYGAVTTYTKEDRSYVGESARITNTFEYDGFRYAVDNLPAGAKVILCVNANMPMVFSDFEKDAGTILIGFGQSNDAFLDILSGKVEPSGLLPMQMPASMEAVEAQLEDVPRDMECYVDSAGNTYDFAFGLNWSGVISDARTAKYDAAPQLALN